ncbi:MAG: hypothetical protein FIA99_17420 [Ruminiclostridium sp.]|nr:hypothetical protein [Ruminiclostridium sp.]
MDTIENSVKKNALRIILKCDEDNDLYRILVNSGYDCLRCENAYDALNEAPEGSGVLILADEYPCAGIEFGHELLEKAVSKKLRIYLEYPASLPGIETGEPYCTQWERTVVSSDFFAPSLEKNLILNQHGCWVLPVKADSPHLVAARVAGYHKAVFGLPAEISPVLFELPGYDVLVAASKLSQFVTGRYGPVYAWKILWKRLLGWLAQTDSIPDLSWKPVVGLQAERDEKLHEDIENKTLQKSFDWFRENIIYSMDWKRGAIEGFNSGIDYQGRQMRRICIRGDCTAETGMVFSYDWALSHNPESRQLATQIFDYVWSAPDFFQDNPDSPVYGLNNWTERNPVFYGDDNANVILSTIAAQSLFKNDRWNEKIIKCLIANLRTTGPLGFRESSLKYPDSFADGRGWQYYRDTEVIEYAPHYQAYLWAANLWAYALTGYEEFFKNTKNAIKMTMEAYPENWRWTNGITQEMARMLLPLAFLVRIEDTPEHRGWLNLMAENLLEQMQPCGAICEKIGRIENGNYPPPQSNDTYGVNEASLIQENGDTVCDLLYTANFAFLGLHEAAEATGDAKLKQAENRLAEFLCRIQVCSSAHPYLDGAWMRGFDYELWEYWGSSADIGWGAWCVESGWTNSWIASVMAMRRLGKSLFDLTISKQFKSQLHEILGNEKLY